MYIKSLLQSFTNDMKKYKKIKKHLDKNYFILRKKTYSLLKHFYGVLKKRKSNKI